MSYVLDALRRAEAERQRGSVPGLHAQPAAMAPTPAPTRRPPALAWWTAGGAGLLLLIGLGVGLLADADRREAAPNPARTVAAPAPTTPALTTPAPAPPVPAPAVAPPVGAAPGRQALSPVPAEAPAPPVAAVAPVAPAPPAPPAAPVPAPLPQLADLPEALRREMPPLQFGGAVDSPQASARMLIVNGQVLREGDSLAPGLVLHSIRLRSAVFELRGQRFEVRF